MTTIAINRYSVTYSSNQFSPRIGLMDGDAYVAQLNFHPDGAPLPADGLLNGQPNLHLHLADFANVIDLLRNEAPLDLIFNGDGSTSENALHAFRETIGEGDRNRRR